MTLRNKIKRNKIPICIRTLVRVRAVDILLRFASWQFCRVRLAVIAVAAWHCVTEHVMTMINSLSIDQALIKFLQRIVTRTLVKTLSEVAPRISLYNMNEIVNTASCKQNILVFFYLGSTVLVPIMPAA